MYPSWKYELFTAEVPKINIGTYNGKTISEIKILFFFKLTVNAAAIDPIKLNVGVPTRRLISKIEVVSVSTPRIIEIKGAINMTGTLDVNQCEKIFAYTFISKLALLI